MHAIGWTLPEREQVALTDEPKTPAYLCAPIEVDEDAAETGWVTADSLGHAMDLDRATARVKAVAECIERLSLRNPPAEELRGEETPPSNRCDPSLFRSYSSEQLTSLDDYLADLRQGSYRWWPAKDVRTGEAIHIPAQVLFLSGLFDDEPQIRGERISTGAALGPIGTGHAFASGLFEAVERDETISAYLTRREIARIVDLPPAILELVDYLGRYRLEPHVFDVTSDLGIPTALVVTLDRTGLGPAVQTGSASAGTYRQAILRALLESVQSRRAIRLARSLEPSEDVAEDQVTSVEARYRYWWPLERIRDLDFWLETDREVSYERLARAEVSAADAVEAIASRDYHLFVADLTRPEVRAQGFEVVKVVIPELHPRYVDERHKYLYSGRHGDIADDPSLKPHPFT